MLLLQCLGSMDAIDEQGGFDIQVTAVEHDRRYPCGELIRNGTAIRYASIGATFVFTRQVVVVEIALLSV